jgi:hypothetical protein
MMAPPIVGHADAPSDVRDYFAAVRTLTGQLAEAQFVGSAEIVSALHATGAGPVLLKGAATLAQGLYPSRDLRLMSDIDVLINDTKMRDCTDTLGRLGYRERKHRRSIVSDVPKEAPRVVAASPEFYHDPPLIHQHTGIRVELHRALSVPEFAVLVPAQDALRRATPVSANGMAFSVLAPTDRIAHHVMHAQLHHHGARSAIVGLRQLVDLAILVDAFGSDIDWTVTRTRSPTISPTWRCY